MKVYLSSLFTILLISLFLVPDCDAKKPKKKRKEIDVKDNGDGSFHVLVDEYDDTQFFDLEAKRFFNNKNMSFDRFEGYLTVVGNLGKLCHMPQAIDEVLLAMEDLLETWPYSLNVVLFPYPHPKLNYDEHDCSHFEHTIASTQENSKLKDKLYMMEETVLNGKEAHPVYEWLKDQTDMEEMFEEYATFFFIGLDGRRIDVVQGDFQNVKKHVQRLTQNNYEL